MPHTKQTYSQKDDTFLHIKRKPWWWFLMINYFHVYEFVPGYPYTLMILMILFFVFMMGTKRQVRVAWILNIIFCVQYSLESQHHVFYTNVSVRVSCLFVYVHLCLLYHHQWTAFISRVQRPMTDWVEKSCFNTLFSSSAYKCVCVVCVSIISKTK